MSTAYDTPGSIESALRDAITPIEEIIADAAKGKMYILVDHEDRENEGDLIIPAEFATADAVNFMATHGRGLICLPMTAERVDRLGLPMMAVNNSSRMETPFTVSIEAREGVTTGISAPDRALTIATAINEQNTMAALSTPGHVFPLRARAGGVLARAGHTEASVDISRLAGLKPAAVICEIMKEDGEMARLPDLVDFAKTHNLKIGTISDLIAYRHKHDNLVTETRSRTVHSEHGGEWLMRVFADQITGTEHIALIKGDISGPAPVLVRAHALNELEDVLGLGDESSQTVPHAMKIIAEEGRGAVLLFREPHPKLDFGDEDDAPKIVKRTGLGSQIMATLGMSEMILLTDSPRTRYLGIEAYGLSIIGTRPIHQKD
ncbi:3,4-dihydroxy-2-butanone-4-phosphate synthase [Rhodobacteraceae bacterium LMO-12]|nr:3,4-dihydroxy-2-butanone-4-phosphate synthase [Rhodobacteraceae bacterium LMO-JJ12]